MLIKCKRKQNSWIELAKILERIGYNIMLYRKGGDPQAANLGQ